MTERLRMPPERTGQTYSFKVGELEGYLTTGEYGNGSLGEIFISVAKQGSTISGLMNVIAQMTSMLLQYGVPLEKLAEKMRDIEFEPKGVTNDVEIQRANSIIDYIFRRLYIDYGKEAHVDAT